MDDILFCSSMLIYRRNFVFHEFMLSLRFVAKASVRIIVQNCFKLVSAIVTKSLIIHTASYDNLLDMYKHMYNICILYKKNHNRIRGL